MDRDDQRRGLVGLGLVEVDRLAEVRPVAQVADVRQRVLRDLVLRALDLAGDVLAGEREDRRERAAVVIDTGDFGREVELLPFDASFSAACHGERPREKHRPRGVHVARLDAVRRDDTRVAW